MVSSLKERKKMASLKNDTENSLSVVILSIFSLSSAIVSFRTISAALSALFDRFVAHAVYTKTATEEITIIYFRKKKCCEKNVCRSEEPGEKRKGKKKRKIIIVDAGNVLIIFHPLFYNTKI